MHVTAIIAAGGYGRRLGASVPKQLMTLGDRPMLLWSVEAFLRSDRVDQVVVVVPPSVAAQPPAYLADGRVTLVAGGPRRQDSVANGFDAASPASDIIVIHDAARPFVDGPLIARVIEAAAASGAAIAAVPARDTVKWAATPARGERGERVIERTLARESVFLAQTPQAFRRDVLRQAIDLGRHGAEVTDEAALAEQAGHCVRLVESSPRNLKVTTIDDLAIAKALMTTTDTAEEGGAGPRAVAAIRVGTGYDLHRLVEGRPLILGGVLIPSDRGLAGHSDADALCHAITDAILGAAAAGDLGQHFPDTDEQWRGASSIALLEQAVGLVRARRFRVVNVDATIIAERPTLAAHRPAMVARLAAALGIPEESVGVKAKTNEGVGPTGRGEAVAVHAVALLERLAAAAD